MKQIFICRCDQCKAQKNARKNRKYKKKVRRTLNRFRRDPKNWDLNKIKSFYWA